jgi:hypothetical protein
MRRLTVVRIAAAAVAASALALVLTGAAEAYIYVGSQGQGSIARSFLDGTSVNSSFVTGGNGLSDVRVNGAHVYWSQGGFSFGTNPFNPNDHGVGRADLDGSNVNQTFVNIGSAGANGIAVNSQYIFIVGFNGTTVKRVALDGTGAVTTIVSDAAAATNKVAADESFVYWTNLDSSVGRADVNGGSENNHFIDPTACSCGGISGIDVDAGHIYFGAGGNVGRADLDGTNVNSTFITGGASVGTVDVDSQHVFWANSESGRVGRADLDGSNANQDFMTGLDSHLYGIAVDAAGVPVSSAPPKVNTSSPSVGVKTGSYRGAWTHSPTSYMTKWLRCDALTGTGCTDVSSYHSSGTYKPTTADVGSVLRVSVFATNGDGAGEAALSAPTTDAVVLNPPTIITPPAITASTPTVGVKLGAYRGQWTGEPTSYMTQYSRCDTGSAVCTPITDFRSSGTYKPVPADAGFALRVTVQATNAAGTGVAFSAMSAVVQP